MGTTGSGISDQLSGWIMVF